jgi:hypothetical protein
VYLTFILGVILEYLRVVISESNQFNGMGIYVDTGVSVIIAYVLLILINFQYYILVPFPICLLGFIAYLWKKDPGQGQIAATMQKTRGYKEF